LLGALEHVAARMVNSAVRRAKVIGT
jgi:hypothetical protein